MAVAPLLMLVLNANADSNAANQRASAERLRQQDNRE
jgi:hypothetical protein